MLRVQTLSTMFVAVALLAYGCGGNEATPSNEATPTKTAPTPPASFSQVDMITGTGTQAARFARLTVNYTGWVYDASKPDNKGDKFDTSIGRGPFSFNSGNGEVIEGWDQGFIGMRVGGKRRLIIPPDLGYGAKGYGPIPPNAGLVFEMELLEVR